MLLLPRGYTPVSRRWARSEAIFLGQSAHSCLVCRGRFGWPFQGRFQEPGYIVPLKIRRRLLATATSETADQCVASWAPTATFDITPCGENDMQGTPCSAHPLEQLLHEGGLPDAWVDLLRETCSGLPLPRHRIWGGSYREVIPIALPPPLRLCLSVAPKEEEETRARAGSGAAEFSSFVPGATENRLEAASTAASGKAAPTRFRGAPIPREVLLGLLRAVGITHLLPLQQLSLPLLLHSQSDVLLAGPAGTGKSLAAAVALLCRLISEWRAPLDTAGPSPEGPPSRGCVQALVVTPTRDMAVQTRNFLFALGRYTPLRVGLLLGRGPGEIREEGAPWRRFGSLQRGRPHVLVCTPGKAEELTHFLLAAKQTRLEQTGQVPQGTAELLSSCRMLVIEDAGLQLQEPLMLRTLAKLKELLPPGRVVYIIPSRRLWCCVHGVRTIILIPNGWVVCLWYSVRCRPQIYHVDQQPFLECAKQRGTSDASECFLPQLHRKPHADDSRIFTKSSPPATPPIASILHLDRERHPSPRGEWGRGDPGPFGCHRTTYRIRCCCCSEATSGT